MQKNSKASDLHRLGLNLEYKINLKRKFKESQYLLYIDNIKSHIKAIILKLSTPTLSKGFDVTNGSFSVSDIQNYLEHFNKVHENLIITLQ